MKGKTMKGYKKTEIRAAGVMPADLIRIGDKFYRIREYKQLSITNSVQLVLKSFDRPDTPIVILSLDNNTPITVLSPKK